MALPKRKNNIQIYQGNELVDRRQELLDNITKHDTYLPESILHDDLDLGMLNFVKNSFKIISDGKQIPIYDRILTIQRWGEFSSNWEFSDDDGNIELPIITVVRKPDPQPGTNPVLQRTIPDRLQFHYQTVKTWSGNMVGADVYKIPQPVAVDISFEIHIICNKIRDLNRFNKIVLQKFSSRQAYTTVKGHYIPIVLEKNSDESPIDSIDSRRFYTQTYDFTMLGFLIDDEEFEVKPAINRSLMVYEVAETPTKKQYIDNNVRITTVNFTGDGSQTLFNVGESIGVLFYVTINGDIQERDVNYYHITNTFNVTFASPPPNNSDILIAYYPRKSYVNSKLENINGQVVQVKHEYFTFDGSTLTFVTEKYIDSIIYVEINGLIETEGLGYELTTPTNITLLSPPLTGSVIGVSYFY